MSENQSMFLYHLASVQAEATQLFIVAKGSQLIHEQLNVLCILPVTEITLSCWTRAVNIPACKPKITMQLLYNQVLCSQPDLSALQLAT